VLECCLCYDITASLHRGKRTGHCIRIARAGEVYNSNPQRAQAGEVRRLVLPTALLQYDDIGIPPFRCITFAMNDVEVERG
jgi:hypothetical protein